MGIAQPASATPNNCTADGDYFWSTEQDMAQSQTEWCRETWVVDPGYGNFLSREDLLRQHAGFYDQQGFTRQFLWYALQQPVSVPANSGLRWSDCANHDPQRNNGECLPVNVNTNPDHTISYDFGGRAVSLSSLSWGDNFIALVCGNFNVPLALDGTGKVPAPVPTIRGMKFDDINHNGVQDTGEGGVGGVTFRLIRTWSYYGDQGTGVVKTAQSEADGTFTFRLDGEGPGTYIVQEDTPAGWISTTGTTSQPINVDPGAGDKEFDVAAFGNRPEHAPVAVAGPQQTVDQSDPAGAQVTLDGSGSSDSDGDPLTYTWTGPFGTATGPNPTVEFPPGGPWTATLTVNDGIENSTTPASTSVTVYPPVTVHGQDINTVEGQPFSGTVGTFTDPDPAGTVDDYAATIDWGDGTPTTRGSITKGADGTFTVNGDHTYAEDGPRAATVTVTDTDVPFNTGTASFTATVADAALTATGTDFLSTNPVNQAVATFTDANPGGPLSDFTASIDWGDGTPATPGTITGPTGGPFTVSGQHTYQELGPKTIIVTIVDEGGQTAITRIPTRGIVYAPSGFVIGDQNAAVGTHVTYWGAQWWKDNGLSGGPAPAAFKGYENSPGASTSLSAWSTDPGNSSQPPASVPSYMAVIVSSSITQNGSVISGDAPHVVIVKTDPGYANDPGHAGTGTVVATLR